jgi:GNAT superfamily N-acetyltransferase
MSIIVRQGNTGDLPGVLALVKELAEFEKAPGEVEVTVEEMIRWSTGPEKVFDFFVAEKSGNIVGIAVYYYKYSTWKGRCIFLEDIIVTASERKQGIGKLLFNEMVKLAKQEKVRRLEWQVLEWNADAIEFYKKYASKFDGEWINCKLTFEQLQSL